MTVDVGLIGFGLGGATFHAPFIARTQGLRLAAIVTTKEARRASAQAEYPDTDVLPGVDELLALEPQLVAISTPNATHYPLAKRALEAGAHVVVDKPFAATSAEARDLVALAQRCGRLVIPFQNRRWDADFLTVRSLIDSGALGEIIRFESRFDRWRATRKPGWQAPDAAANAESVLFDLGAHLIDQALVLFGPVKSVYAELKAIDASVRTCDDMFLSLVHVNGMTSHLSATMSAGISAPRFHVYGSKSSYVKHGVDVQEAQLRAGIRPGTPGYGEEPESMWGSIGCGAETIRFPAPKADYSPFYAGVARAIIDGSAPPVTPDLVIAGLDIIEAALRQSGTI